MKMSNPISARLSNEDLYKLYELMEYFKDNYYLNLNKSDMIKTSISYMHSIYLKKLND